MEKTNNYEWFTKHVDTVVILSAVIGSLLWMNHKFNNLEKDIIMVKTVLILKNIMPVELAHNDSKDSKSQ